jgi:energy-coupling factor transporter transmembrane protein EcfT
MLNRERPRADPINALLWLVVFNLTVLQEDRVLFQIVYLAEVLGCALFVFRITLYDFSTTAWRILFIPSLLFVFHLFVHPGHVLVGLGVFRITDQGVFWGSLFFLRFINAVMAAVAFGLAIRLNDLIASLSRLGIPDKGCLSVYLTLRYIPLLANEAATIWAAVKARRIAQRANLFERGRVFSQYVVTLVLRAVDRAETSAIAIQYRQFGAVVRRTYMSPSRWKPLGLAILVPHAIIVAMSLWGK